MSVTTAFLMVFAYDLVICLVDLKISSSNLPGIILYTAKSYKALHKPDVSYSSAARFTPLFNNLRVCFQFIARPSLDSGSHIPKAGLS